MSENCVRLAATNASASEQIAITTARPASARTASRPEPGDRVEHAPRHDRLQRRRGGRADDQEAAGLEQVVLRGGREDGERAGRSCAVPARARGRAARRGRTATQISPTTVAASRLASEAGRDDLGQAGKRHRRRDQHDRVDRGRRSRNASAAAAGAPRDDEPPGDRHRAALAPRQRGAGHGGHRHRERRPVGQDARRKPGGHERGDRRADA